MIAIGQHHTLTILRSTGVGLFLGNPQTEDVILLPNKYVPQHYQVGDELRVFVYLDQQERPVATTLEPYIHLNDFALLRVNYTNQLGAFLDWGLEKDLFVPFKEQARKMEQGKRYLVYLYLDEKTQRLVASSKTNQFLSNVDIQLEKGQEVDLIVSHTTELGLNVIVNQKHKGLIYKDEIFDERIRLGDRITGYVKAIRADHKLDISLQKEGFENVEESAQIILEALKSKKGFLRLNDKSHPDDIKVLLNMSKKTFKKAVGTLYRERLVEIKDDGIYLVN